MNKKSNGLLRSRLLKPSLLLGMFVVLSGCGKEDVKDYVEAKSKAEINRFQDRIEEKSKEEVKRAGNWLQDNAKEEVKRAGNRLQDNAKEEVKRVGNRLQDNVKKEAKGFADSTKKEANRLKNRWSASSEPQNTYCQNESITQQAMLAAVNQARQQGRFCGDTYYPAAPELIWNDHLAQAASVHAQDMVIHNHFNHVGTNGSTIRSRTVDAGYPRYSHIAENIAVGTENIEKTVASWLDSDKHCANLMNVRYQDFGMSCMYDEKAQYHYYWVQNLGRQ